MSVGNPNNPSAVNSTLILVLGILSVIGFSFLGPVAWIMGNQAMRILNSGGADPSQQTNVKVGWVCGIIGTVFLILTIAYLIAVFAFGMTMLNKVQNLQTEPPTISSPTGVTIPQGTPSSDPFGEAIMQGNIKKMKMMLAKDPSIATKKGPIGETPLFNAAFFGHKEVVELLLARGVDVNAKNDFGETALDRAQSFHQNDIVALLKSHGAVNGKKSE